MRLIDADALERVIMMMPYEELCADCCYNVLTKLDDAPTVIGWVSVQERLPEKSGWYLVSLVNTCTGHRWEVPVPADYSHGEWDYAYVGGKDATWMLNNMVTHWMPRLEPPEEVNEDA